VWVTVIMVVTVLDYGIAKILGWEGVSINRYLNIENIIFVVALQNFDH